MSFDNDDLFSWNDTPEITFTNDPLAKLPYAECSSCPLLAYPCVGATAIIPQDSVSLITVGDFPTWQDVQYNEVLNAHKADQPGALLNAVLTSAGFVPTEVYRTNAVMCKPPTNNLREYGTAVKACRKRLEAELAQYPTSPVVALGLTALDALSNVQHTPTFHPANVLRRTQYITQFLSDIRAINRTPTVDWYHITPVILNDDTRQTFITELGDWYYNKTMIAFDVETPNLIDKRLLALGLTAFDDKAWIISGDYLAHDESLKEILTHFLKGAKLVAHNGKFDQQVLTANGLGEFTVTDDTMLMHHCLDEQKGTHGLKHVAANYLGLHDYEAELIDTHFRNQDRDERDYSTIPQDTLYQYLAIDCCATLALWKLFNPLLDTDSVRQAYQINIDAANVLVKTEAWGIKIDRPYLTRVNYHLTNAVGEAENTVQLDAREYTQQYLDTVPSTEWYQLATISWVKSVDHYRSFLDKIINGSISNSGGKKRKLTGVNLSSWQQMQILLYDILKLKHVKKLGWKTDVRSTNAEALDALVDHPFVRVLQEYRKLTKIKGTYVEKLLTIADNQDRVHVRYNLQGTETDRMSANDGLHGIPRATDIWGQALRGSFIVEKGYKLGKCDYAQAELRVFAALSNETFLLDMFANGDDPHGTITLEVFGNDPRFAGMTKESYNKTTEKWSIPQVAGYTEKEQQAYWKEKRTTGKNVVFGGLVYQGKAPGIVAMIRAQTGKDVDIKIVDHVLTSMLARMPNAAAWQKEQFRHARDKGFVQTRLGFKRRFPLITEDTLEDVKKASVNAPVQGVVAQLLKIAATQLIHQNVRILMLNHDELVFEMPESEAEQTAQLVKQTMINVAANVFPECAWRADVEIGDRWYDARPEF